MNHKSSAYALFYGLALAFWLLTRDISESTLLCVFYSVFVGTVWGLIPKVSGTEPLTWKWMLPPFMLIVLMMFSARMRMMMSSEVVMVTAMALIHFRASMLAFTRLPRNARFFSWLQLASFAVALIFIFQKNLFSFIIPRNAFVMVIMGISLFSMGMLSVVKRKTHEPIIDEIKTETDDHTIGS